MPAEQLGDLDEGTLQAMHAAVKKAASGKKYQIEQFGPTGRLRGRELDEVKRHYKSLRQLEHILAANTTQARTSGRPATSQEAHRGK